MFTENWCSWLNAALNQLTLVTSCPVSCITFQKPPRLVLDRSQIPPVWWFWWNSPHNPLREVTSCAFCVQNWIFLNSLCHNHLVAQDNSVWRELFAYRFSFQQCNFWRWLLPVKTMPLSKPLLAWSINSLSINPTWNLYFIWVYNTRFVILVEHVSKELWHQRLT